MKIVTLLTDFGIHDTYVGEMKGVLYSFGVDIDVVDITHDISPQDIKGGAFCLLNSYSFFPEGTVHMVVVDPGVGTDRAVLAVETTNYRFIGPDNGVLYEAITDDGIKAIYSIDVEKLRRTLLKSYRSNNVIRKIAERGPSSTFHGRDIFAPLAGYLLAGFDVSDISIRVDRISDYRIDKPEIKNDSILGEVIFVDRFGNLITNIDSKLLNKAPDDYEVFLFTGQKKIYIGKLKKSYGYSEEGRPVALVGSRNKLEIAVNRGNALKYFNAGPGTKVEVLRAAKG